MFQVAPYVGALVNPFHRDTEYEWWVRSNVTDGCQAIRKEGLTTENDCNIHKYDDFGVKYWRKPLCQLGKSFLSSKIF